MFGSRPHVSVAVSNLGVQSIQSTLDALLAQAHRDLEVLVCEYASDNADASIGRDYATRDARVRCLPVAEQPSAAVNLRRALEVARGDYFLWNTADERCDPALIARCAAALDADPSLVLVFEQDPARNTARPGSAEKQPLANRSAWRRLAHLLFRRNRVGGPDRFQGLMRLDWLRHTDLPSGAGIDRRILLAQLALCGRIGEVAPSSMRDAMDAEPSAGQEDRSAGADLPRWHAIRGYFRAVRQTWMAPIQKVMCYAVVTSFAILMLPMLVIDLLAAAVRAAGHPLVLLWPADNEWAPRRRAMRRSRTAPVLGSLATADRPLRPIPDHLETLEVSNSSRVA